MYNFRTREHQQSVHWKFSPRILRVPATSTNPGYATTQGRYVLWRHNGRDGVSNHWRLDCSVVCQAVCSGVNQRKHQSSASLAFVRGIHRWPVDPPHKQFLRKAAPGSTGWKRHLAGETASQRTSNAENASISWRHHDSRVNGTIYTQWCGI